MPHPDSLAAITGMIMGMTFEAALKGSIGEAAKDLYSELKARLSMHSAGEPPASGQIEIPPSSEIFQEALESLPPEEQLAITELLKRLIRELPETKHSAPVGAILRSIDAAQMRIKSLTVTEGVGLEADHIRVTGDVEIGDIIVGDLGKTKQ